MKNSKSLSILLSMGALKKLFIMTVLGFYFYSYAGVFELGASTTFRSSQIDANNFTETQSLTASISYYFWEMSAIEISLTDGLSTLGTEDADNNPITYKTQFNMTGVDFVFTFAGREAMLQPYIKAGGAQISKKVYRELNDGSVTKISDTGTGDIVPSAGVGLKVLLTKTLSIKASYDTWKSSSSGTSSDKLDQAWRVGLSWLL